MNRSKTRLRFAVKFQVMARNVVVAGVGPGLGAALVRKFSENGGSVAMLARSGDYLRSLTKEHAHRRLCAVPTDPEQADASNAGFKKVHDEFGAGHALI